MTTFKTIAIAASIALTAFGTPAFADTQSKTVRVNDLDLRTANGSIELADRLERAANLVCRRATDRSVASLSDRHIVKTDFEKCVTKALDQAVAQLEDEDAQNAITEELSLRG